MTFQLLYSIGVGSLPYPQTLDYTVKVCHGQALSNLFQTFVTGNTKGGNITVP
jgi:hypothetical protein